MLVLSANVTPQAIEECYSAGAAEFVPKPLRASLLLDTIERHVGVHTGAGASDRQPSALSEQTPSLNLTESPDLDELVLSELCKLSKDQSFVDRLLRGFAGDIDRLVAEINTALGERNFEAVKDCAHALKGGAASVGAKQLAQFALRLEKASHDSLRSKAVAWSQELSSLATRPRTGSSVFSRSAHGDTHLPTRGVNQQNLREQAARRWRERTSSTRRQRAAEREPADPSFANRVPLDAVQRLPIQTRRRSIHSAGLALSSILLLESSTPISALRMFTHKAIYGGFARTFRCNDIDNTEVVELPRGINRAACYEFVREPSTHLSGEKAKCAHSREKIEKYFRKPHPSAFLGDQNGADNALRSLPKSITLQQRWLSYRDRNCDAMGKDFQRNFRHKRGAWNDPRVQSRPGRIQDPRRMKTPGTFEAKTPYRTLCDSTP